MGRKIQKVITVFLLFFIVFFSGCKDEVKNTINDKESTLEKEIEKQEISLKFDITQKILGNFKEDIAEYLFEGKRKETENFIIKWNLYTVYWRSPISKFDFLKEEFPEDKYILKTNSEDLKFYEINVYAKVLLPDESINEIQIFSFYFPKKVAKKKVNKPQIALVVDDLVEKNYWTDLLLSFPYTLNVAIIPTSHSEKLAEEFAKEGWEVIAHVPMESISYPKDAKYLVSEPIMVGMSEEEIEKLLDVYIKRFGKVKILGLNNHMGSKVTKDVNTMENLFKVLRKHNLFFLDSRTISSSVGKKVANEYKVSFLENMLFIDHENDNEKIKKRFIQAINITKKKGKGVFICHLRPKTIKVLEELEKEKVFSDIEFVKLSDLLAEEYNLPLEEEEFHTHKFSQ
ncbi:MAG TPA: divergent polysaccharide deacetylase family protein [Dictyoglomaceae bacterium]|nr:divergent polysaccharide deacetylase family protein [Dictyoglomaceae bacterium]HPP16149.1 divergent polysaccharide deacetylase family protein [Dictyoglomaceae bacterium]